MWSERCRRGRRRGVRKGKSHFHGKKKPQKSGKLKELYQDWSRGGWVEGERDPKLKLEHPKIQPWVVEREKLEGRKGAKLGAKRGF